MTMRRKLFTGITSLASVAVLMVSLPTASSQQAPTTREFFSPEGAGFEKFVDVGKRGLNAGDYFLITAPLLDPATEQRVGKSVGTCTIVKLIPDNTLQTCAIEARLQEGKIATYGAFNLGKLGTGAVIAIAGGTGDFSETAGTLTLRDEEFNGQRGVLLTFDIR